jgi:hypothetical protein
MSFVHGFRGRLVLQALVTGLYALLGAASGWTVPTLVVAAAAVFVALAMRPEPVWRTCTVAFEGVALLFGLAGLVSGHYVPGTIVGAWTLAYLLRPDAAAQFDGAPVDALTEPAAAYVPAGQLVGVHAGGRTVLPGMQPAPDPDPEPVAATPEPAPVAAPEPFLAPAVEPVAVVEIPAQALPPVAAVVAQSAATCPAARTVLPGR